MKNFIGTPVSHFRDESASKRFHGAFTGGFSAGYMNTVGSREGWKPSQFISSKDRRDVIEDNSSIFRYMDEEDVFGFLDEEVKTNKHSREKLSVLSDEQGLVEILQTESRNIENMGSLKPHDNNTSMSQGFGVSVLEEEDEDIYDLNGEMCNKQNHSQTSIHSPSKHNLPVQKSSFVRMKENPFMLVDLYLDLASRENALSLSSLYKTTIIEYPKEEDGQSVKQFDKAKTESMTKYRWCSTDQEPYILSPIAERFKSSEMVGDEPVLSKNRFKEQSITRVDILEGNVQKFIFPSILYKRLAIKNPYPGHSKTKTKPVLDDGTMKRILSESRFKNVVKFESVQNTEDDDLEYMVEMLDSRPDMDFYKSIFVTCGRRPSGEKKTIKSAEVPRLIFNKKDAKKEKRQAAPYTQRNRNKLSFT